MHATGILTKSGKKFWSTKDKGQKPFACKVSDHTLALALSLVALLQLLQRLQADPSTVVVTQMGVGQLIPGWDQGVLGMKLGEVSCEQTKSNQSA